MIELKRFTYAPVFIQAVQVTEENMQEVAEFCGGEVVRGKDDEPDYIRLRTKGALTKRPTAYEGDWIFKSGTTYKIYTEKAFQRVFVEVASDPKAVKLLEEVFSGPAVPAVVPQMKANVPQS
jgi:hypothetical protein